MCSFFFPSNFFYFKIGKFYKGYLTRLIDVNFLKHMRKIKLFGLVYDVVKIGQSKLHIVWTAKLVGRRLVKLFWKFGLKFVHDINIHHVGHMRRNLPGLVPKSAVVNTIDVQQGSRKCIQQGSLMELGNLVSFS